MEDLTKKSKFTIPALASHLPHSCGVYLFKDGKGSVVYVGKAKDLKDRVGSYFRTAKDSRYHIQFLLPRVKDVDFIVTDNEQEALILENNLIKRYRPRYNIFLKDDKTYVNLRLNLDHPFPRLTVVRNPRKDKALYFGPFASAGAVRETLRTLGRVFPLRVCSDVELKSRNRPCLYYHIKRCPAPCVDIVDPQNYRETVNKVVMFLRGRGKELLESLQEKMKIESAERRYEQAARTRDQIWAIQRTLEKQRITSPQRAERDVFAVYRKGGRMVIKGLYVRDGRLSGGDSFIFDNASLPNHEHLSSFLSQYYQRGTVVPEEVIVSEQLDEKPALEELLHAKKGSKVKIVFPKKGERRKLLEMAMANARAAFEGKEPSGRSREILEDLRAILDLGKFPRKIECFDVSNLRGKEAVGSRVAFIDGEPARALYRRYRIRTVRGADDYAMMKEVLERRVARGVREGDLPDLLIVDGGRGQLNVAVEVLESFGCSDIDVLGVAKAREKEDKKKGKKVKGREHLYTRALPEPLLVEGNSAALFLLERIRDEAHRFAIAYHKKVRSKKLGTSVLDGVPGIGPVLKTRLLSHFGGIGGIKRATEEELSSVKGVSRSLAGRIKKALAEGDARSGE